MTSRVPRQRTWTIEKPWGREEVFGYVEGRFCGKVLHVNAGHALSTQYHLEKEEVIAVQSGVGQLDVGPSPEELETIEIKAGDAFHMAPGTVHRITAVTDLVLLEVSTPEIDDVVRIADRYGRAEPVASEDAERG
jgi:mannose-6-phosphate isomerase